MIVPNLALRHPSSFVDKRCRSAPESRLNDGSLCLRISVEAATGFAAEIAGIDHLA